jgi:hypothetical protein
MSEHRPSLRYSSKGCVLQCLSEHGSRKVPLRFGVHKDQLEELAMLSGDAYDAELQRLHDSMVNLKYGSKRSGL